MKVLVNWEEEPTPEEIYLVGTADIGETSDPELIISALKVIIEALQEGELARVRFGCLGRQKQIELLIKGDDPVAQGELLADLSYAIDHASNLFAKYGSIDLDTVPLFETDIGAFTLGNLLRSGISPALTNDPAKCRRIEELMKRLKAFSEEVATINRPYYPYIETDTINRKKLASVVRDAIELLRIAGGV